MLHVWRTRCGGTSTESYFFEVGKWNDEIRRDPEVAVADARRRVRRAYMSISEVAEYLGINPRTVRRMISTRVLSANRISRQWRIPTKEVEALEKRTCPSPT